MRKVFFSILCIAATVTAYKRTPLKTKKYKCIEINEDENELRKFTHWDKEDEELKPIGSAKLGGSATEAPIYYTTPKPQAKTSNFISPMDPPRDAHGNPLILSPQHCAQVKHYASMYGVSDVLSWIKSNCAFAKMYLPNATCEEINILVGSCYPDHPQPTVTSTESSPTPVRRFGMRRTHRPSTSTTSAPSSSSSSLFGNWGSMKWPLWQ